MQKDPRREEDKRRKQNASELGGGAEGEGLFQTKLEHTMKEFKFKGYVEKKNGYIWTTRRRATKVEYKKKRGNMKE